MLLDGPSVTPLCPGCSRMPFLFLGLCRLPSPGGEPLAGQALALPVEQRLELPAGYHLWELPCQLPWELLWQLPWELQWHLPWEKP